MRVNEISPQQEHPANDKQNKEYKFKKILIAIDKSGFKEKIIQNGIVLSKAFDSSLLAIHVLDKAAMGMEWNLLSFYRGGRIENYESALIKESEELLNEVKIMAQKHGIAVETKVIINSPSSAESIIDYAKDNGVDLIIIGTKGLAGIDKFVMGGVANKVISHAHCRVLAIR